MSVAGEDLISSCGWLEKVRKEVKEGGEGENLPGSLTYLV